ncbi:MAG: hypothetical protein CM1200mP39_28290 [Dehalococcoidia bacterium]|nr:MAG: hypothetical protein CM1200mP39_28290 [Dehalococcoidia bacterium]
MELADRILAKYPDFDPSWDPSVQTRWLEGMTRLYEGLSVGVSDRLSDREVALRGYYLNVIELIFEKKRPLRSGAAFSNTFERRG